MDIYKDSANHIRQLFKKLSSGLVAYFVGSYVYGEIIPGKSDIDVAIFCSELPMPTTASDALVETAKRYIITQFYIHGPKDTPPRSHIFRKRIEANRELISGKDIVDNWPAVDHVKLLKEIDLLIAQKIMLFRSKEYSAIQINKSIDYLAYESLRTILFAARCLSISKKNNQLKGEQVLFDDGGAADLFDGNHRRFIDDLWYASKCDELYQFGKSIGRRGLINTASNISEYIRCRIRLPFSLE